MERLRPYYHQFAWAYDLLQNDAVEPRVDFIDGLLRGRQITDEVALLDAGCGTGRYAVEFAKRGYCVTGVDRSSDLIDIARSRAAKEAMNVCLVTADLLDVSFPNSFDAVLCRGVLNDFVADAARSAIFRQFAGWLRAGGTLIFDVREWSKSVLRYSKDPVHRRTVELQNGILRFQSDTTLDASGHRLLIRERFELEQSGESTTVENDFVMRCWTPDEIREHLLAAGLTELETFPGYGDRTWSDRLVVVATRN